MKWKFVVNQTSRHLAAVCTVAAVLMTVVTVSAEKEILRKSLIGQVPPELISAKEHWLGKSTPTTLEQLKGNVVWLQFNF